MQRPLILDSSALLATYFQEPGAAFVLDGMRDAADRLFIHGANTCEVAYKLLQHGWPWRTVWQYSPPASVRQIDDIKGTLGTRAVALKSTHPFLSLADCLAIALSEQLEGDVITSDRQFSKVATTAKVILIR